jgi:hypothetical protein
MRRPLRLRLKELIRRDSPVSNGSRLRHTDRMTTAFGVAALTFMMLMYALERRGQHLILAFALGCVLSSAYGFLAGTWPFGVVELMWALHRRLSEHGSA